LKQNPIGGIVFVEMRQPCPRFDEPRLSGNLARIELDSVGRFGCYSQLHFEDREFTNIEELAHAGRLAHLLKDCGVKPGGRVFVVLPNSPDLTAAFHAVWMIGAVIAPIMPAWTADEILPVLADGEPACVLTFPLIAPRIHEALKALALNARLLVFGATDVEGAINISPLLASATPIETPEERRRADLALLLYTSGTTAVPRGAMVPPGNLDSSLDSMCRLNHDIPPGPVLHALPLSYSFGLLLLNLANKWEYWNRCSGTLSHMRPWFPPCSCICCSIRSCDVST
jgi:acyl-coenzyme A synthetase/AMP-(fatty) acid ligase